MEEWWDDGRVIAWRKLSNKKLLCTARSNWLSLSTTFFNKKSCHQITIDLHEVIFLDKENLTVTVEPNVTVRDICKYLIPKGYALAVTLEVGDATLGGLAFGVGMTTHSHKVGLYQETIISYEVVTASGDVVTVTAQNEHADLFYCLPWSHGTLAFLVALKLKIIRVKPYVKITYIPCHSQEEYCNRMMKLSGALDKDHCVPDFLEATIFTRDKAVILAGNFEEVDTWEKWFRPDQKLNYLKVFQDIVMPLSTLKEQVNTSERLFNIYPLLVYPCRVYDHQRGHQGQLRPPPCNLLVPGTNYAMFNDLGVYGIPGFVRRKEPYIPTYSMRAMEKFTREVGGYSFLYADLFMTEDEFNKMFDMTLYEKV
uniref:Delta(24)-sterol reductase n=1 Tax=Heterorhabditis bacteriophora TaxID=37862 RepID=A0A1I7X9W9_HETBA